MEAFIPLIVVLVLFYLFVVPILTIAALVKSSGKQAVIDRLEEDLAQMRRRLWRLEQIEELSREDSGEVKSAAPAPVVQRSESAVRKIPEDIELTTISETEKEPLPEESVIPVDPPLVPGESFTLEVGGKEVVMEPVDVEPSPDDAYLPSDETLNTDIELEPVDPEKRFELDESVEPEPVSQTVEESEPAAAPVAVEAVQKASAPKEGGLAGIMKILSDVNAFVLVGLVVLFAGLAFFLKYSSDNDILVVPIELRLAGVGAVGVILTGLGWFLRGKKESYSLLLQGQGLGITYLTIFASFKMFGVLPPLAALGLMAVTGGAAVCLAVLQNARTLALVSIIGGFLAPMLTASGSSNHVLLFSYFLLLNLVVFAITNYRPWRSLTIVSFYFTFVIAALWGASSYHADKFSTVEPFLIIFWLLYIGIALFHAFRQPPKLRGFVDGTILFGTPIAAFTLQASMVNQFPFAMAFSALAASIVYTSISVLIWKRKDEKLHMLAESLLVVGVLFGTVAIPFALTELQELTVAVWALEGAGILWVALRYNRVYARYIGIAIECIALLAFVITAEEIGAGSILFLNGFTLGAIMISLSMICSSYWQRNRQSLSAPALYVIGFVTLLVAGAYQIDYHASDVETGLTLFYIAVSAVTFILGRRLLWKPQTLSSFIIVPTLIISYLNLTFDNEFLFGSLSGFAVILGIVVWYLELQFAHEESLYKKVNETFHVVTLIALTALFTRDGWLLLEPHFGEGSLWRMAYVPLVPIGMIWFMIVSPIPLMQKYRESFLRYTGGVIIGALTLWSFSQIGLNGVQEGMAYYPLVNPIDLVQLLAIFTLVFWWRRAGITVSYAVRSLLAGFIFLWANAMVLRTIAHHSDMPYRIDEMLVSPVAQSTITIFWTLYGTAYMIVGTRFSRRSTWIGGASLLGVVSCKLMLDLLMQQSLIRIVTFIVVGIIFMAVGYFSPFPQKKNEESK